jgi:hypothetical protein
LALPDFKRDADAPNWEQTVMMHQNTRAFFDLWVEKRKRLWPSTDLLLPGALASTLSRHRFELRPTAEHGFRITELGDSVVQFLGRSPLGTPFKWLFHVGDRSEVERLALGAHQDGTGIVIAAEGADDSANRVSAEIILLSALPGAPPSLIGCLSVFDETAEAKTGPIGLLRLVAMRVLMVPPPAANALSILRDKMVALELQQP